MAYEPSTENLYPFQLATGGMQDLDPPFCYSTIFQHELGPNATNPMDTIVSVGFRDLGSQILQVPFMIEVGPIVRVRYFGATADFPYVTRLGPDEFTYLTVCVEENGPIKISAYVEGCRVDPVSLPPQSVTPTTTAFNSGTAFVYMGEEQTPFDVSSVCLRLYKSSAYIGSSTLCSAYVAYYVLY